MFIHTVTVRPWLGQGVMGPEYGGAVALRCRVDFTRRKTKSLGAAAQEIIASGAVFCPAGTRMEPESLIEFDGQTYTALSCRPCHDWLGENHVEVEIQ